MKKILFSLLFIITGLVVFGFNTPSIQHYNQYHWTEMVKPGHGSFQENWKIGTWPMAIMPVTGMDNKLWMIGHNRSWSSGDGINWEMQPKTDWGERHGMSFTFFKNKIWMMAGMRSWDDFRNDTWSSADGKKWEQVILHNPWGERRDHHVLVYKNRLWLIGGAVSTGKANKTPVEFHHDIWVSDDGMQWKQISDHLPWNVNDATRIIVFREKIWMINTADHETWNTDDGLHWSFVTKELPWEKRTGCGLLEFDNRLWLFGGRELNDVWFTDDGLQWHQLDINTPWSARSAQYSISFKNKLLLFSGKTGREDSWAGDIWTLHRLPAGK